LETIMKTLSTLAIAISLILGAPAFADDEHHPEKAAAARSATPQASPNVPATVRKMQGNVKKMQTQLHRIGKAKTDTARQAAMAEHLQTMQENMHLARGMMDQSMDCAEMHGAMMGGAAAGEGTAERMQHMERRMEMMERMMRGQPGAASQAPAR
jgi:hypothetical protein